ncbi:MAG: hypothetical protein ACOZF2_04745 [Thermodesulfobacteriota bacterium]
MKRARWENFILLSVLTLILVGPVWGDGMPGSAQAGFTDYGSFLGEYQAAGALRFYDNTEELLRLAQFERALMRYRFLKGQIQRRGDYRGLLAMVDLRLGFLKKQLHLTNRDIAAIPPRRVRIPQVKPPTPPAAKKKDEAAKPKTPGAAAKDKNKNNQKGKAALTIPGQAPPVYVITGPPPNAGKPPATAAPGATAASPATTAQKPSDVVTSDAKTKGEKSEEEKEATKPAKPLSVWQKLKLRLHLN